MAVKLRLKRMGKKGRYFFRIVAMDSRWPRDGKSLEIVGTYDPQSADEAKKVVLNRERVVHWLDHGAIPTDTVSSILRKNGIYAGKR